LQPGLLVAGGGRVNGQLVLSLAAIFAAFCYAFFLLIGSGKKVRFPFLIWLLLLFALQEIFDLLALRRPEELFHWKHFGLICEALLPFTVVAFALTFYRADGLRRARLLSRALLASSLLFLVPVLLWGPGDFFFAPDFGNENLLFLTRTGFFFYVFLMFYLTCALVLLEQTMTSLAVHERWSIKFEIVGAGLLPAVALIYYSQSLLYRSLDMGFLPARSAAVIFGVGLMFYSRIRRGGGNPISVSRSVAFHSLVVIALSLYLVGLGLLGEGMRYLGGTSQKNIFMLVVIVSGCGLLALLLSENLRRKVNVFLHKNFFRNKYDYREQWLEFTRRLADAVSFTQLQERVLAFFCEVFGLTGATLYLREDESGDFKAVSRFRVAPAVELIAAGNSLVRLLEGREWVYNVADNRDDEVGRENENFFREERVSLIVPLTRAGRLEGLVVCGPLINPRESFSYEDYDLLKALARQAALALATQRLSRELGLAREMAAIGRVSAFVLHDLKNQVSSLSLMVENAADFLDDPEFQQDMLETLSGTIEKMKKLMERLKNLRVEPGLELKEIDLVRLVEKTAAGLEGNIVFRGEGELFLRCDPEKVGTVILNLLLNAFEAGGGTAAEPVELSVGRHESGQIFIRVGDRGCGMSAEFIANQLFKPFSTTKNKGLGIGLYQCRQIIEAHGGRIEVESTVGRGTVFTVLLPSVEESA
jgi:putative PEP-CTERM system histidine kinase